MAPADVVVEVEGRPLKLSNLAKVLYPEAGTTKAEVLDYYARIAPVLLHHLGDRPVTLNRFPDGPGGGSFYEKNCPRFKPEWMTTYPTQGEDGVIDFCRVDSVAALTWVVNLAALELHTPMHRGDDADAPQMVVFDLDPGAPAGLLECADIALLLRDVLGGFGLTTVVKTSGSKGLQVYLPLNTPTTYGRTAGFSKAVAEVMEAANPKTVVSVQRKDRRVGKVLVDWSQNSRHKTTVCTYSMRARPRPWVSTPLSWDEVEAAHEERDIGLLTFEHGEVVDRVARLGDLFAPAADLAQSLPDLDFPDAASTRIVR